VVELEYPLPLTITNMLLDALLGVIVAVNPVSVADALAIDINVEKVPCTTCKTVPAGNAALATPVQFVNTPLAGVPNAGVVSTGLVRVLLVRV
jgi:hypothetical protein